MYWLQAFTLIELLVVMAIIILLAAMVVGGARIATDKSRKARAQAEIKTIESAIESYKIKKGFYPPCNTNSTTTNALFYELTGTIQTNVNNSGADFFSAQTQELLMRPSGGARSVQNLFGGGGMLNSSPDAAEIKNYFSQMKAAQRASFKVPGGGNATFTLLVTEVPGPFEIDSSSPGGKRNPWHYLTGDAAVHNRDTFDLWVDIVSGGHTNRVSNWSDVPDVVNDYQK